MNIQRSKTARYNFEYGCNLRRLYPWNDVVQPDWGSAIARLSVGTSTTIHSHDEKETFIILKGNGRITVDEAQEFVEEGDVIYLPPMSMHTIQNTSESEELVFLTIFWDNNE